MTNTSTKKLYSSKLHRKTKQKVNQKTFERTLAIQKNRRIRKIRNATQKYQNMEFILIWSPFCYWIRWLRCSVLLHIIQNSFITNFLRHQNGLERYYNFICQKPIMFLLLFLFSIVQIMKEYWKTQSKSKETTNKYSQKISRSVVIDFLIKYKSPLIIIHY